MIRRTVLLMLASLAATPLAAQQRPPIVLAAASMQEAMNDAANAWALQGHPRPVLAFAASSALARQVEAGAPADLFVSADTAWIDELARRRLLADGTRATLARGQLVVVSRAAAGSLRGLKGAALARVLGAGPIAMADPASVPAGRYGQQALTKLGAWSAIAPRVVRTENVRAALALVERGAAPYAVVYATDARASTRVRIAGVFPANSHTPVVYPIARLARSNSREGEAFRRFLLSPAGQAVFVRRGFMAR
ncbi:molybdate ABC transporter substrate-binding protein [Sphingomonas sp. RHCKR47]|uniref:molybdate ABC transporter substrate-binding protein n=1 Tax=Sphingomonas citricola TaxID=2862498 RepID=UPI001CA47AA3|nr:molybdate ABC transporter substrate-binding protein [Sphingomonas citricola]MBW6522624.1 molybdate ABC transporter substrate-binding protein [Sphingomonas citricola]